MFKRLAISAWPSLSWGRNSCKGGSSKRTVTGNPSIALKIPSKSFLCRGRSFFRAFSRPARSFARIISRMAQIRSPSKNICSVRVSPIPWAPIKRAFWASFGESALVLTLIFLVLSAHFMTSKNIWQIGCLKAFLLPSTIPETTGEDEVSTCPRMISPVDPSTETSSPSLIVLPATEIDFFL